eukprot:463291-Pleurochrysis_carterae.AAC.1
MQGAPISGSGAECVCLSCRAAVRSDARASVKWRCSCRSRRSYPWNDTTRRARARSTIATELSENARKQKLGRRHRPARATNWGEVLRDRAL